jgi:hypothetical protein
MTELDTRTLRRALRTREDLGETVDIAAIVGRGRALRRRRRYVAIAGAACAVTAIFGALTAITHLTRPANAPAHYPVISGKIAPAPSPSFPARHASQHAVIGTPTPTVIPKASPTAVAAPSWSGSGATVPTPSSSPTPVRASRATATAASGAPLATPSP